MKTFRQCIKRIAKQWEKLVNWWRNYDIKEKTQILLVLFSCFSFIAIVVLGCIQGCQTRKGLKITNSTLELSRTDLRAYVVITKLIPLNLKVGERINIPYEINNVGKSPAINVSVVSRFKIYKDTSEISAEYVWIQRYFNRHKEQGFVMGVSNPIQRNPLSDSVFNIKDSILFLKKTQNMFLLTAIRYNDIFGEPHNTVSCYIYQSPGNIIFPYTNYNRMD